MGPPPRIPTSNNAEGITSTLYSAAMSGKIPGPVKQVVDLLTGLMRVTTHRRTLWNMGKCVRAFLPSCTPPHSSKASYR